MFFMIRELHEIEFNLVRQSRGLLPTTWDQNIDISTVTRQLHMAPVLFSSQLRFAKMSLKQNGGFLSSCTSLYRTCHKYKSKPVYPSEHVSKDVMKYETLLLKNCTNSEAHIQSWNDKVICFFRSNLKSFGLEIMLVRRNCFRFETEEKLKTDVYLKKLYRHFDERHAQLIGQ